jgi:5-(carboxyamino)imidazole ribonucleotide synthase
MSESKPYFSTDRTLGILGGGQLGKMLLYQTRKWDIRTKVMDPSAAAPARLSCNEFVQGDLMDYDAVMAFGRDVDLLTIEIENVNVDALEDLAASGIEVYPQPGTLRIIQNKASQKLFYTDHDIPTAPFNRFAYTSEIKDSIHNGGLAFPFVWKSARFGYDGQGVRIIRGFADLEGLPNVECIAERLIPFVNELAVIVARNSNGEVRTYPVVEMEFHPEANQVEYVLCPARISEDIEKKAREVALKVSESLEQVGLLAVELFQTVEGDILVNEVAPRPHNSGHYSIEGSFTDQFEQHLRAILGLPLGITENKVATVMVNLVGAEGYRGPVVYRGIEEVLSFPGVNPHIYGKKETRPFRKMGHVTIADTSLDRARETAARVKATLEVRAEKESI